MSNSGHAFWPAASQDDFDEMSWAGIRVPEQHLSHIDHVRQQFVPDSAARDMLWDPSLPNSLPVDFQPDVQDDYLDSFANLDHVGAATMDGHTPPQLDSTWAITPSPDSDSFPTGFAPLVPSTLPRYSNQGFVQASWNLQASMGVPAIGGHNVGFQQSPMVHGMSQQPRSPYVIPHDYHDQMQSPPGAHHTTSVPVRLNTATFYDSHHGGPSTLPTAHAAPLRLQQTPVRHDAAMGNACSIGSATLHDVKGNRGTNKFGASFSSTADASGQNNLADELSREDQHQQLLTPSGDTHKATPQKQTLLVQTPAGLPNEGASFVGAAQKPSTKAKQVSSSKDFKRTKSTSKTLAQPKTDNDMADLQSTLKLGPEVTASAHPPHHDLDGAMQTLIPVHNITGKAIRGWKENNQAANEDATSVASTVLAKRTASEAVEEDDDVIGGDRTQKKPKHKRNKSDDSAEFEFEARPEKGTKTGRSAKLAELEEFILPDYGNAVLSFSNVAAALTSLQDRLKSIEGAFIPVGEDPTVPQSDEQIKDAVKIVLGAMKDLDHAKDHNSRAFKSRWREGALHPYSDEVLETTSWKIVVSDIQIIN